MKNSWPKRSERPKGLVLIQDGVGDRPVESLGGQTPLEAARTPQMDALARRGAAGMMDVVEPGEEAATHTGHLALFGQDSRSCDYRRGPIEAAGVGFDLKPDDVALRFNFATINGGQRIVDRRAGRIRGQAETLIESLQQIQLPGPVELFFLKATEHRGVLVLRGEDLSPHVTDSDPGSLNSHREVREVRPTIGGRAAVRTAAYLNLIIRQSHDILDAHPVNRQRRRDNLPPANIILTRGAGTSQRFLNLPQKLGLRVACVSGEATVLGLARLSGIRPVKTDAMTANLDTDLDAKASSVTQCLESYDLVYLHLKGCDIASHDRSPDEKVAFIERTDRMLGGMLSRLNGRHKLYLALLGDHATLSETGDHSDDPVPVCLTGEDIAPDRVSRYCESACAHGSLGRRGAMEIMEQLFDRLILIPDSHGENELANGPQLTSAS